MNKAKRKEVLLEKLKGYAKDRDAEGAHADADDALIEFINDAEIAAAYKDVAKWYA